MATSGLALTSVGFYAFCSKLINICNATGQRELAFFPLHIHTDLMTNLETEVW